jgi:hypothetical protein
MKQSTRILRVFAVILLCLFFVTCEELVDVVPDCERNQVATLKVTNESNHRQKCILNGANIATLNPGQSHERTIQTGFYWIEFKYMNNTLCCSAAYFEARACRQYSYSCSN